MRALVTAFLLAVVPWPLSAQTQSPGENGGTVTMDRCSDMADKGSRWVGTGRGPAEVLRIAEALEGAICRNAGNLELAAKLYQDLFESGDCMVAFRLGWNKLQGSSETVKRERARWYFRHGAMCLAGALDENTWKFLFSYMGSRGVPAEMTEALDWTHAIDSSPPERQYEMALAALDGTSIPKVPWAAELWMSRAAHAGFVPAQYRFARWLLDGDLGKKDESSAQILLVEAARAGFPRAQADLGIFHARKNEATANFRAYVWLRMAEKNGINVTPILSEVTARLTDDQRAGGDRMVATGNSPGR